MASSWSFWLRALMFGGGAFLVTVIVTVAMFLALRRKKPPQGFDVLPSQKQDRP